MGEAEAEAEAEAVEEPEFRWGRKSKSTGKMKKTQFYESFTYDDVEYVRYDCIYLYEEGVQEPSIGKLLKMWETRDKKKKGKVLWFFQPSEISNFIGDEVMLENELLLASGEGFGLTNINPLEAIAGKCNVVCISKDIRNRQPTDEEIANAEYVFRRTFDVNSCKIKDELDKIISGTDVKLLLNRECAGGGISTLNAATEGKEITNAVPNNSSVVASVGDTSKECEAVKTNGHYNDTTTIEATDLNDLLTKPESLTAEKTASGPCGEQGDTEKSNPADLDNLLTEPKSSTAEKTASGRCGEKGDPTKATPADLDDLLTKSESSTAEMTAIGEQGKMAKDNQTKEHVSSHKDSSRFNVESKNSEKGKIKRAKESDDLLDVRPSKKAKLGSDASGRETVAPTASAVDDDEVKPPKNSEIEKGPFKRLKRADKATVIFNGKLPEQAHGEDHKKEGQQLEGASKPDAGTLTPETDKSKWFSGLPWEDRITNAHEKGRLVLLQNLDPSYTSAEVEDIVRQGFKEKCSAKMIQRTAISSPHSGQAFVIFEGKDTAKTAIKRLEAGCLLLPNGRPLLGRIVTPFFPEKKPAFSGHLCIDKLRHHMQREQRDAVSTSHCAQPYTVEYDMALAWLSFQEKSALEWKMLYEEQGQDLKKLKIQRKKR